MHSLYLITLSPPLLLPPPPPTIVLPGGGGGGYSAHSWVSAAKLTKKVVVVNLHKSS